MAPRGRTDTPVTQSLLDRLDTGFEAPTSRAASIAVFKAGIRRDIEWLLNTRRTGEDSLERCPQALNSVATYGLPDIAELGAGVVGPTQVLESIRSTLKVHEPRIRDPRITLIREDKLRRSFRFHVEGTVMIENSEEDISFDTLLDTVNGEFTDPTRGDIRRG
ncbi:type VI secretion system protein ImpF [Bryocella elongata]|uniref:Type VI secretion system protein ImpF n=1 Tax=Bryocella elongata TaxID=863522 RepID=A0A1H6ACA7_9BACT|nr:type VI secretion system baseplate subunit TssE [Bryocella elongata]SEG46348.1 type VI secretion system protein ImpF [Bryocella elongata]